MVVRGVGGGGFELRLGREAKDRDRARYRRKRVRWLEASQVFTVSVLIFVGLDIHGSMVRLARIL